MLGYLWDWLADGWRDAAAALEQGKELTLPLTAGPLSFVWTARPVHFLPVVGGTPLPHSESNCQFLWMSSCDLMTRDADACAVLPLVVGGSVGRVRVSSC